MAARRAASTAALGALAAATAAAAADAADDTAVARAVTADARALAVASPKLVAALGEPLTASPWWSASIAARRRARAAVVTFEVAGARGSADVTVRAVEARPDPSSWPLTRLARRWARGGWTLVAVDATLPTGRPGPAVAVSLMERDEGAAPARTHTATK